MINPSIFRIFGRHDKKQEQESQDVIDMAGEKKQEFSDTMDKLLDQSKKLHAKAITNLKNSQDIVRITEDITQKIAVVTEKRRINSG